MRHTRVYLKGKNHWSFFKFTPYDSVVLLRHKYRLARLRYLLFKACYHLWLNAYYQRYDTCTQVPRNALLRCDLPWERICAQGVPMWLIQQGSSKGMTCYHLWFCYMLYLRLTNKPYRHKLSYSVPAPKGSTGRASHRSFEGCASKS